MTAEPHKRASDARQRILLVTGLSGAGKTTVLQVLEDLGWEAIDNFPVRLLGGLVAPDSDAPPAPLAIGFDTRTRGFDASEIAQLCGHLAERADIALTTMFIDCADGEIERRYNETRRPHPMARERPVQEGIAAERAVLEPLRSWADIVVDTTDYTTNRLQQVVREEFAGSAGREMALSVVSFGFARGAPPPADLMFDMRYLDNPHWVPELRDLTGRDKAVAAHIERDPAFAPSFGRIADVLRELLPHYARQGRGYVTVAFGCTGGRHRSVHAAEAAAKVLRDAGFSPTVIHRNLETPSAAEQERR